MKEPFHVAILDDYQHVALSMADWPLLQGKAQLTVFNDHLSDKAGVIERLQPFQIVCVMRERTPLTKEILSALPRLKLIVSTGQRNASIDIKAAEELGIELKHTGYVMTGAPEMTWALLMAAARNIVEENIHFREGGWQKGMGIDLTGKTIGIIGLGNIGSKIAKYATAFDMKVIAWSENLTPEAAEKQGASWVSKETLMRESDFVTIHMVLSHRSRGIITAADFDQMKPTAWFINTSRGPLVDEFALIDAIRTRKIAGAALDVFDQEPLPKDHPFRTMEHVLITPHIGYVTENTYGVFYQDTLEAILQWLSGQE